MRYNLFIKDLTNFSLAGANRSLIIHSFLSSKNHCGINISSFCWLNLWKTSFMTWIEKPASKYLIFILFVSFLKFYAILLALNYSVKFKIVWNTQKTKSLFNYKDKVSHCSRIIYRGMYSCRADYIGESFVSNRE